MEELVNTIREQTVTLLFNMSTAIKTCDMDAILCDMPVWKHVYHVLHSLDRWFINPVEYQEPPFHEVDLNSLDIPSGRVLIREELLSYFETIKNKLYLYLDALTDDMLCEKPSGCPYNRMALVLGQFRHLYAHMGNINATTILATGKWPRVVGMDADFSKGPYEE